MYLAATSATIKLNSDHSLSERKLSPVKSLQVPVIDSLDKQDYDVLENFKGFEEIDDFKKGKIYRNSNHVIKLRASLNFAQSARSIIELFTHLENWNSYVKDLKLIQTLEKGVYKMAIFFHKSGCFSKPKYSEVIVSLYKVPDGYFLTMRTLEKVPAHVRDEWMSFKLVIRVRETLENFS
jgi:hypothetical protein